MRLSKSTFFLAVEEGDSVAVRRMAGVKPGMVNEVMKSGPRWSLGLTPLTMALTLSHWGVARCLIELGADVSFVPDQVLAAKAGASTTALHLAMFHAIDVSSRPDQKYEECCVQLVEVILEKGASVSMRDSDGLSPLRWICTFFLRFGEGDIERHLNLIERFAGSLIAAGADPCEESEFVKTYGDDPRMRRILGYD